MMAETVEFINVYTDIVVENFLAVVKQNLLFQAQLKVAQVLTTQLDQLKQEAKAHDESVSEFARLRNENQIVIQELDQVKTQLTTYLGAQADHHRIQTALNEHMRDNAALRGKITELSNPKTSSVCRALYDEKAALEAIVQEHQHTIATLDALVAPSKRKKLGPAFAGPLAISTNEVEVSSGGIF